MSDYEQEAPIDDETKAEIAAEFLKYAPPGEFEEEQFNVFFSQNLCDIGDERVIGHFKLPKINKKIFSSCSFETWFSRFSL